ncbi:MAG: hypothetical protein Q9200_007505, partial [Gallowayella weberi]
MVPIRIFLLLLSAINWSCVESLICFKQPPPPRPQHFTTIFKFCADAIKELAKLDKAHAPINFSRKRGVGYKVPDSWRERTCFIVIDMHSDDDEDDISFYEIAVEAGVIAGACVLQEPHLGGTTPVGPKKVMNVTIVG